MNPLRKRVSRIEDVLAYREDILAQAGVDGVMRLPNHVLHLIVGPNADQYAAEMAGQLA